MTRHIVFGSSRKGFYLRVLFFIAILTITALMYLESRMLIDIVYFILVLGLFIKYLIMKLYH